MVKTSVRVMKNLEQYLWYLQYIQVLWIQDFECSEYILLPLTFLNQKTSETEDNDARSTCPFCFRNHWRTVWRTKWRGDTVSCEEGMLLGNTDINGLDEKEGKPVSAVRNCIAKMTFPWHVNWGASSKHLSHPSILKLWRALPELPHLS